MASSRFWAGASSSEEEEDSDASESDVPENTVKPTNRWATVSDSESSDEGERVVKSAKDRAWEGMRSEVTKIKNSMKINDWTGILNEFEVLNKMIEKAKMLIIKEGGVPRFYIRTLSELEDFLLEALKDKEGQKKMNAANGRALNRMKLALRRHNKLYEDDIAEYRTNPDQADDEEEEDDSEDESSSDSSDESSDESDDEDSSAEESESEEEGVIKNKTPKELADMDSDDWASSSEDEESSSESEVETGELRGRARWLKSATVTTGKTKQRKTQQERIDLKAAEKRRKAEALAEKISKTEAVVKGTVFGKPLEDNLTAEQFDKKVLEVVAHRGRKGTDGRELVTALIVLVERAALQFDLRRQLATLMHLIAAQLDLGTRGAVDDYMETQAWRQCLDRIAKVVQVLDAHPNIILTAVGDDELADLHVVAQAAKAAKRTETNDETPDAATETPAGTTDENDETQEATDASAAAAGADAAPKKDGIIEARVAGNIHTFITRLEDEYLKSLQRINPHTQEYVSRLKDEAPLVEVARGAQAYFERVSDFKAAAALALLRVEHVYYKHESIATSVREAQAYRAKWGRKADAHPACGKKSTVLIGDDEKEDNTAKSIERNVESIHPGAWLGAPSIRLEPVDDAAVVKSLCEYVYKHGDDRSKTRALLCHVAHHGLHGRFAQGRDLLLMSHLQDTVYMSDIETHILYNRAMVFLGLCAFRHGLIADAHACLAEICSTRVKELLAQGVQISRYSDKNTEQEKAERRRQTPYHMHINLDLLECCHLTSAMLLEVPHMALDEAVARGAGAVGTPPRQHRPISKHFRKHMDIYNRQVFTGPPENTRDHLLAAAKALMHGDWRKCAGLVLGLDVWNLVPGTNAVVEIKEVVAAKIKSEGLRAYLFATCNAYDSISLDVLCKSFEIDRKTAHAVISKMMISGELRASWDQPTNTMVLQRTDPTPLQSLATNYADKLAQLVESNERLLDARAGNFGPQQDRFGGKDGDNKQVRWNSGNQNWNRDGKNYHKSRNEWGAGSNYKGNRPQGRYIDRRRGDRSAGGGRRGGGDRGQSIYGDAVPSSRGLTTRRW